MSLLEWVKFAEWVKGSPLTSGEMERLDIIMNRKNVSDTMKSIQLMSTLDHDPLDLYRRSTA